MSNPATSPPTRFPCRRRTLVLAVLALGICSFAGTLSGTAQAGPSDHELARQALREGRILPLRTVLDIMERDHKGQVLEVELERDDGLFIYEIKLLQQDGVLVKLKLDAATGRVIGIKQKRKH
ncbi:PepSY domain-containing protein [Diaphorobacter ruginosibacter]|uniref:PepSY domain-containing protein n=1 Tax=Diaphorobacter ruginosibacter TaxID=1715720 RepID=UPI00333F54FC